jgi:hypothetical protein
MHSVPFRVSAFSVPLLGDLERPTFTSIATHRLRGLGSGLLSPFLDLPMPSLLQHQHPLLKRSFGSKLFVLPQPSNMPHPFASFPAALQSTLTASILSRSLTPSRRRGLTTLSSSFPAASCLSRTLTSASSISLGISMLWWMPFPVHCCMLLPSMPRACRSFLSNPPLFAQGTPFHPLDARRGMRRDVKALPLIPATLLRAVDGCPLL